MDQLKLKQDGNRNPIPVLSIGLSEDIAGNYVCQPGVVRIIAIVESRVWYRKSEELKQGVGLFLQTGSVIDVSVLDGYTIEVEGSVNITKYI